MTSPVVAYPGALSAAGVAKETAFGVLPGTYAPIFAPVTESSIDPDPGIFYPEVMTGLRDLDIYALQGQIKIAGSLAGPLYPTSGAPMLLGAIGTDTGVGGANPGGTQKVGTVTAVAVGATSLTYVLVSGAAPAIGDYFSLGVVGGTYGSAGAIAGNQVVVLTNVSGGGPYTLTVAALQFKVATTGNGGAGLNACSVIAPFTHALTYSNTLPSFTVEKNTGGHQSIQYLGSKVNKLNLKCSATNEAVTYQADYMCQGYDVLDSPTAIILDQSPPWVFAEASLNVFGDSSVVNMSTFEANFDNGIKDVWTLNGTHELQFLVPASFKASGTMTAVWTSFDDADWGYFNKALSATQGVLTASFTHPSNNKESLVLSFPQVNFTKYKDDLKTKDVVMSNLTWEASYQFSSSTRFTAYLTNTVNTGY
jgi:hypothetical protein